MKVLGGIYKGRTLKTPKTIKTRPTASKVKESIFNILQREIEEADFLDLFAGSGAMGIEALSRGAKSVTFVEKERVAAQCIRENLKGLDLEAHLIQSDAFVAVKRLVKEGKQFAIIFLDPPYSLDLSPLLPELFHLLAQGGSLLIEQGRDADLTVPNLHHCDTRFFGDTAVLFFTK